MELSAEDWSKARAIPAEALGEISSGSVLRLSLSKISGAGYSVIRVCPKGSDVSLEMASISVQAADSASLVASESGGAPDGKGKNISLSGDASTVSYTLTSADCEKINSAGGIVILGYGVKINNASLQD